MKSNGTGASQPMAPKTVLIADDEPSLRVLVNATIASDEYTVVEAEDGDQAWKLLTEQVPTIALLDVRMPGPSGLELTRAIKASSRLRNTTVILLTCNAGESDMKAGLAAGAHRYLTKPFSPLELLTAVEQSVSVA